MTRRRRRYAIGALALTLIVTSVVVAAVTMNGAKVAANAPSEETLELSPALQAKMAQGQAFAPPGSKQEGDKSEVDDEWLKHVLPGNEIASSVIAASSNDWEKVKGRNAGGGKWRPLGPTWAKGLPNPFRDRAVYNAGTPDFSGRIAHVAIDPNCDSNGGGDDEDDNGKCRLWIANANGGVWRTENALKKNPTWKYLSKVFEHNNTASLELDPNDEKADTIYVGTGEPNACGSGCEAGVGIYKSENGGSSWSGPLGVESFYNRAVGSIEVKPGDPGTIFAASGRAIRGLSNVCCGGVDALIPGAPDFGLYRSKNGGQSWELVNQGATTNCAPAIPPDIYSLGGTPCSPRGARRVKIDPVDPHTVYASFFARGIWRSKANGDVNTWEQIMPPLGGGNNERAEFDVVKLPSGETRMYVGVGSGAGQTAKFRRSDAVRNPPAAAVAAGFVTLTNDVPDTPGYSSFGYCDPQCSYDNYVYAPAAHFPNSGADADTVYLSGDNEYSENNWGPESPFCCPDNPALGRSNGRSVLLSTNAGVHFTDMTDDASDDVYPVELHPDHHALVVNPTNYKQFFDVGDGGIVRSNGKFVDDSADCVQPKGYTGSALTFCQLVLSRVPEKLTTINEGLRTLHFYQLNVSPHDPDLIVGGTQDNGSWERGDQTGSGTNSAAVPPHTVGVPRENCRNEHGFGGGGDDEDDGNQIWVNTNIADGGHNNFDIGDSCFRQSAFQLGQLMVAYEPKNQVDMNWVADSLFVLYGNELVPFIGPVTNDPKNAHWLWTAREHVFRSTNQGRNKALTKEQHRTACNIWYGTFDVDGNGVYEPLKDICDDFEPAGDPGPNGRLTSPTYGDRAGGSVAAVERTKGDANTVWAATQTGRIFVSKNANAPTGAAIVFDRIDDDPTATNDPPRYPTGIYVDPKNTNRAWITYSGFNAKTPGTPGHVFEVTYVPGGSSTFKLLDGNQPRDHIGDIPATSITVTSDGVIYVGTDYGVIVSKGDGVWREAGKGLPHMPAADLLLVPERNVIYAATHGQGVWELKVGKGGGGDD
ncbi:MAG: hypothetical protein MSC30_11945 [Gaiellaceae bacterium MAG52_C11]|nr:hypothetical protein [Candidatus Gaiellasilicea maunaloa]